MSANKFAYKKLCSLFYDAAKKFASTEELDFYLSFITTYPNPKILEAMTGTGRIQIPLMRMGYTISGVDRSPIMLSRCKTRAAEFNLTPVLYEQSLEQLKLPDLYDVIIIAVASFQLITDKNLALQALMQLKAHMHTKSTLLLDIFTPYYNQDVSSERVARIDATHTIKQTTRHVYDISAKQAQAFCYFQLFNNGILIEEDNELLEMTWYEDDEFKELCAQAGLQLITVHEKQYPGMAPARIAEIKVA